ncbi:MAG: hypothetical protein ACOYXO_16560 [Chloroflexota bacterium]
MSWVVGVNVRNGDGVEVVSVCGVADRVEVGSVSMGPFGVQAAKAIANIVPNKNHRYILFPSIDTRWNVLCLKDIPVCAADIDRPRSAAIITI